jgi:hypothetical protein
MEEAEGKRIIESLLETRIAGSLQTKARGRQNQAPLKSNTLEFILRFAFRAVLVLFLLLFDLLAEIADSPAFNGRPIPVLAEILGYIILIPSEIQHE